MSKICTSVKLSRRLIELGIDVNTADMHYMYRHWEIDENTVGAQSDAHIGFDSDFYYGADNGKTYHYIPAWSLSALSEFILPYITDNDMNNYKFYISKDGLNRWIAYYKSDDVSIHICEESDNMIDVILEMICWLKNEEYI